MSTPLSNSTYGLSTDWSYRAEQFLYVPLTWKLGVSRIDALKIRIANWKPRYDRSNQAIHYFDVLTKEEANKILENFSNFDFLGLENRFDELFELHKVRMMNTGDTRIWLKDIISQLRQKFSVTN